MCHFFKHLFVILISLFALNAMPNHQAWAQSSEHEVITDYEVYVTSLRLRLSDATSPEEHLKPAELQVEGRIEKAGQKRSISGTLDGASIPHPEIAKVRKYLSLFHIDDALFLEQNPEAVARIDGDRVVPEARWNWHVIYREYRYSLWQKLLAKAMGSPVEDHEDLYLQLDAH